MKSKPILLKRTSSHNRKRAYGLTPLIVAITLLVLSIGLLFAARLLFDDRYALWVILSGILNESKEGASYLWPILLTIAGWIGINLSFGVLFVTLRGNGYSKYILRPKTKQVTMRHRCILLVFAILMMHYLIRVTVGISEEPMFSGCIIGLGEPFTSIHRDICEMSRLTLTSWVFGEIMYPVVGQKRLFLILFNIQSALSFLFAGILIALDIRLESWLMPVYLTMAGLIILGMCLICRAINQRE